ncbi:MAG: M17 family peptidase N-terminal domain-containing protein, partial [Hydrogenophilaceae bacterium]
MEFSIKSRSPEIMKTACAVVGVYEQRKLTLAAQALDLASEGGLADVLKRGDLDGKAGSTLMLHNLPGLACERVLLVGLGKENEVNDKAYRDAVRAAVKAASGTGATEAALFLVEVPVGEHGTDWKAEQIALSAGEVLYRFDRLKSQKDETRT